MERAIYQFEDLPTGPTAAPGVDARAHGRRAVGVILNVRSHHNANRIPEFGARDDVTIARPATRMDIAHALAKFAQARIGLLVISGGDGTVRDVLTMGQTVFQDNWPQLAVLPRGKTNALNVDLGSPKDWSLAQAIGAFENPGARRVVRRPLAVRDARGDAPPMLGFILGAGAFALGVEAGQDAHKAGFFNSLAVGVTSAWGVVEAALGSDDNRWRRGARMDLRHLADGTPFVRTAFGDPARRTILLASTLQTMPLGLQLFGKGQEGIRAVVLDHPRRLVLMAIPAVLAGWHPRWLAQAGLHHISTQGFTLGIDAPFILDGEHFPPGTWCIEQGPQLTFVAG